MADPTTSKPASVQMYALTVGGVRVPLRADASGNLVLAATIDTTNLALHTDVDGLEALVTSSNTKLDTLHTDVAANTTAQATSAKQDTLATAVASTNTKLDTVNTNLGTIDGHVDGLEASLATVATNTGLIPQAEDNDAQVIKVEERYSSVYISGTAAAQVVKTGAGYVDQISFGTPTTTSVVTLYDNTAASGTVLALFTLVTGQPFSIPLHAPFATGLTVKIATAGCDLRLGWR